MQKSSEIEEQLRKKKLIDEIIDSNLTYLGEEKLFSDTKNSSSRSASSNENNSSSSDNDDGDD